MANVQNSLRKVMGIDGAIGVALVDINDGLTLATAGGGKGLNLEVAGAGNLNVVRAKMRVMEADRAGRQDRGHPDHVAYAVPPDPAPGAEFHRFVPLCRA